MATEIYQRSPVRRIGIMALNLLFPGLGIVRTGDIRRGLLLAAGSIGVLLASIALFRLAPLATFRWSAVFIVFLMSASSAILISALILTWRSSAIRRPERPWPSRWYGLLAIAILADLALGLVVARGHRFYKPFYLPSENMAPTLSKNEKIIADMRFRGPLAIGDIILIRTPSGIYIKRVAAMAGDRIAMEDGVPFVNGKPAIQQDRGPTDFNDGRDAIPARLMQEQLPGERGTHRILDIGPTEIDDMAEEIVPAGHIFVLGDNRDRSADSRVSTEFMGVGMVSLTDIAGRPLFIHWSRDWSRIGLPATH